jgi:AcrR family transcriptional regulator
MSELRRKVLDAAVELVAEQGVRSVSFREVARRASVSHQTPYHLFSSAQGILRAIAQEGFESLTQQMREAGKQAGPDPMRSLEASGVAYVKFARKHLGHFRVMFQGSLVNIHDPAHPMAEAEKTHGTLVDFVAAAHRAGYGSSMPVEIMTLLCWSTVHGLAELIVENTLSKQGAIDPDAMTQATVGALAQLLKGSHR